MTDEKTAVANIIGIIAESIEEEALTEAVQICTAQAEVQETPALASERAINIMRRRIKKAVMQYLGLSSTTMTYEAVEDYYDPLPETVNKKTVPSRNGSNGLLPGGKQ